jgi:hypothetical protein
MAYTKKNPTDALGFSDHSLSIGPHSSNDRFQQFGQELGGIANKVEIPKLEILGSPQIVLCHIDDGQRGPSLASFDHVSSSRPHLSRGANDKDEINLVGRNPVIGFLHHLLVEPFLKPCDAWPEKVVATLWAVGQGLGIDAREFRAGVEEDLLHGVMASRSELSTQRLGVLSVLYVPTGGIGTLDIKQITVQSNNLIGRVPCTNVETFCGEKNPVSLLTNHTLFPVIGGWVRVLCLWAYYRCSGSDTGTLVSSELARLERSDPYLGGP